MNDTREEFERRCAAFYNLTVEQLNERFVIEPYDGRHGPRPAAASRNWQMIRRERWTAAA